MFGLLSYLDGLNSTHDDDLVVTVDGFDSWFQLPPHILVNRYHAINTQAQQRSALERDNSSRAENIHHKIVFSAQKRCWPGDPQSLTCYTAPESSLPPNIYGPQTDTDVGDERNPFLKFRPRYLNSGFAMGPVADMRRVYRRAKEYAEADPEIHSDQLILSTIFAQQQYMRAMRNGTEGARLPASWMGVQDREDFFPVSERNYEFGIGLGYEDTLDVPTVFAEYDSAFIAFGDESTILEALQENNITSSLSSFELQSDVAESRPPFAHFSNNNTDEARTIPGWADVPLYTNLWTGITPVIIHHNAWRDGLKAQRERLWDKVWYQPNARSALDAVIDAEMEPVAVDEKAKKWYAMVGKDVPSEKGLGVRISDSEGGMGWRRWTDICSVEDDSEVFRDEQRPWGLEKREQCFQG